VSIEKAKIIAKNKRAFFDYEIIKKYQAGLSLMGSEIKSIREHKISMLGSFVSIQNGEAFWKGGQIARWESAGQVSHEEDRDRKLLLHKAEIIKMQKFLDEKGLTIVPLSLGLVRGRAKLEIAVAKGKKNYDKRNTIKERDLSRRVKTEY